MSVVELGRFMEDLAQASGKAILPFFRAQFALEDKARGGSPFDRSPRPTGRRRWSWAMIARPSPATASSARKFGTEREDAECVWVLDPIDGTRAFIAGLPTWGTLIGLTRNGVPVRGLMHQPYWVRSSPATGTARLRCAAGGRAHLAHPTLRRSRAGAAGHHRSAPVRGRARRRSGSVPWKGRRASRATAPIATPIAWLAAGQVDLVVEAGLKPYDICALIPIIEGAGGRVTSGMAARRPRAAG